MKILVISTNTIKKPLPVVPVGAGIIFESLKFSGYNVKFLDLNFQDDIFNYLKVNIDMFFPDLICISIRNIDNQVYQNAISFIDFEKEVVEFCKKNNKAIIIIGGAALSIMPEEITEYLGADYAISGYGEKGIVDLVKKIERGDNKLDKIHFKDNRFDLQLSIYPSRQIFNDKYFESNTTRKSSLGYQAIRGCTSSCSYCSSGYSKDNVCYVPSSILLKDLTKITKEYGIHNITFVDDIFNQNINEVIRVCRILSSFKSLEWTCSLSPQNCSKEILKIIKDAGCVFVDLGLDSASDTMLKNLKKSFLFSDILESTKNLESVRIQYSISLLFGGPGETEKTVLETVTNIENLNPTYILAGYGIRIYPNTHLFIQALQEKYISNTQNLLEPTFYISSKVSENFLKNTLNKSRHIYRTMLMKKYKED